MFWFEVSRGIRRLGIEISAPIVLGSGCLLFLLPVVAEAQFLSDVEVSVSPNPVANTAAAVVTVTGMARCYRVDGPFLGETNEIFIQIDVTDPCSLAPPDLQPFTEFLLLEPLSAGIWIIRVTELNPTSSTPQLVTTTQLTVLDPRFDIQVLPASPTENDDILMRIHGFGSAPLLEEVEIEAGRIYVSMFDCGVCDPPPAAGPFVYELSLGPLLAGAYEVELYYGWVRVAEATLAVAPGSTGPFCEPTGTTLCLNQGRFQVRATWTTVTGGIGTARAVEETPDTGLFWFFEANNIELVVKVLDACESEFASFWVFAAGLTDVGVILEVFDIVSEETRIYQSPVGRTFVTVTDTRAFACN